MSMASFRALVLQVESVQDFIQHVLDHHAAPSTILVCFSKDVFLETLQLGSNAGLESSKALAFDTSEKYSSSNSRPIWTAPTLRLISTSRTLKLAFCPDITHLRAYLATYSCTVSKRPDDNDVALRLPGALPTLAILNPIELHRPTSAFSAQGLNRTLSAAVDAAYHTGSKLILCECPTPLAEPISDLGNQTSVNRSERTDPWAEEVPLLNVTTKRLGELSVGRSVRIRSVAERWCTFERLCEDESN